MLISGLEIDRLRERHAAFYTRLSGDIADGLEGDDQALWVERGSVEYPNVYAALSWLIATGNADTAMQMAGNMWPIWLHSGRLLDGRQLLERVLDLSGEVSLPARAHAENGLGILCAVSGDSANAMAALNRSVALWRSDGDISRLTSVLNNMGNVAVAMGDYKAAISHDEEALRSFTEMDDTYRRASVILNMATIAHHTGDARRVVALASQALTLRQAIGDALGIAQAAHNLAIYLDESGAHTQAADHFEEAIEAFRQLRNLPMLADAYVSLATNQHDQGNFADSDTSYRLALDIAQETANGEQVAAVMFELGQNELVRGETGAAITLIHGSLEQHRKIGDPVESILCLELVARIARDAGDTPLAVTLLSYTQRKRSESGYAISLPDVHIDELRQRMTAASFEESCSRAKHAALSDIIDLTYTLDPLFTPDQTPPPVQATPGSDHGLTSRERDVLRLVAKGMTNAEIGEALHISPFTAKTHVQNLLGKLAVESRAAAATWAVRNGILS